MVNATTNPSKVETVVVSYTACPQQRSATETTKKKMATGSEVWVQWFTCCLAQQGPGGRAKRHRSQQQHNRLRIDRSMIGAPTNFQHTGHIGSGDLDMATSHLNAIQTQMQGKGGYETSFGVKAY